MTDSTAPRVPGATAFALGFVGGGIDRHAERRRDAGALAGAPGARTLAMWQGRPLVAGDPDAPGLAWQPMSASLPGTGAGVRIYLGDSGDGPLFAVDVSDWTPESGIAPDLGPGRAGDDQPAPPELVVAGENARFADLRALVSRLSPQDAEIAATAKGILEWHRAHRFCAACGQASTPGQGGWQRQCPACGRAHFPRTDPVVIMLVTRGNRLLLGRSPGWPEGFYSLLAGFMEPGETVEAAVRREVAEETGIETGAVALLNSQPWPFPASLMIGCIAEATSTDIRLDREELDDALWVSREELLAIFAGIHPTISTPRRGAIAAHLMHLWLADRLD